MSTLHLHEIRRYVPVAVFVPLEFERYAVKLLIVGATGSSSSQTA